MAKRLATAAYADGELQRSQLSTHRRHLGQGAQAGEPEPDLPFCDGTDAMGLTIRAGLGQCNQTALGARKQQKAGEHPARDPPGTVHHCVQAQHNPRSSAARRLRNNHQCHSRHQHQLVRPPHIRRSWNTRRTKCTAPLKPQPSEALCQHPLPRSSTRLHAERPGNASLHKAHSTRQTEQAADVRKLGIAETRIGSSARWDLEHGHPKWREWIDLEPQPT